MIAAAIRLEAHGEHLAGDPVGVRIQDRGAAVVGGEADGDAVADVEAELLADVLEETHDIARGALERELLGHARVDRDHERAVGLRLVALAGVRAELVLAGCELLADDSRDAVGAQLVVA